MDFDEANILIFGALNSVGPADLAPAMHALSWLGDYRHLPLYVASLAATALAFRIWGRQGAAGASALAACRLLMAFVVAAPLTAAIKQAVALPRPAVALEGVHVLAAADSEFSFPSGHAVFTGLLVTSIWPLLPGWGRVVALLLAGGVGISRIWLGAHFPGDVVAGMLLGVVVAAWTGWLLRRSRAERDSALAFGAATLIFALDVGTKTAIPYALSFGERIPVAEFFNIVYWRNTGAAFSFLHDAGGWQRSVFILLALAISAWLAREMLKRETVLSLKLAYGFVLGGALGNMFDRVFRGAVVDWLDFHWSGYHWPAFNAADSAISIGVVLLLFQTLVQQTNVLRRLRETVRRTR